MSAIAVRLGEYLVRRHTLQRERGLMEAAQEARFWLRKAMDLSKPVEDRQTFALHALTLLEAELPEELKR